MRTCSVDAGCEVLTDPPIFGLCTAIHCTQSQCQLFYPQPTQCDWDTHALCENELGQCLMSPNATVVVGGGQCGNGRGVHCGDTYAMEEAKFEERCRANVPIRSTHKLDIQAWASISTSLMARHDEKIITRLLPADAKIIWRVDREMQDWTTKVSTVVSLRALSESEVPAPHAMLRYRRRSYLPSVNGKRLAMRGPAYGFNLCCSVDKVAHTHSRMTAMATRRLYTRNDCTPLLPAVMPLYVMLKTTNITMLSATHTQ